MRITYLTTVELAEPTAPAHHVRWRCAAIADMGHEVTMVHARPGLPAEEAAHFHRDIAVWHPNIRGGSHVYRRGLFRALREAGRGAADVVYMRCVLDPALTRVISALPIPVVGELHGLELCGTPEFRQYVEALDLLLVPSDELRAICLDASGVPEDRVAVQAGPGVDALRFAPQDRDAARRKLNWPGGPFTMLFMSGYQDHHDFETLFEAVRRLRAARVEPLLMMLGSGPNQSGAERLAADLVEAGAVRFIDAAPSAEVPTYIAAADACLNVTKRRFLGDGNLRGFKILEYSACARPVIASANRSLPIPSWADRSLSLINPDSPDDLAAAARDIMDHREAWRRRAAEARAYVENNASWPAVARTTVAHLERIVHPGRQKLIVAR
ncbi:MAG TPA: glycosyltransferase family 4 protein [Armatimonadota bacterium]|jgi:glycosyltransferase involved in cell wall biosynthesis